MSRDCEVCRGSKRIRVPIYQPFTAQFEPSMVEDLIIAESSREYPCPECSQDTAPFERLSVGRVEVKGRWDIKDERYQAAMHGALAKQLAQYILENKLMTVTRGPDDANDRTFPLCGVVGVVAPRHVAKFKERVAERQFEVAEALVKENIAEIENWGSDYHSRREGGIGKWQAIEWLQTALKKVRAKYG